MDIGTRVSRTGSITIHRTDAASSSSSSSPLASSYSLPADADVGGPAKHAYARGYRNAAAAGNGGGVSDTLLSLRETGREFERRQQQLDEDLERLSLRLAETAAVHFSPLPAARDSPLVINREETPPPTLDTAAGHAGNGDTSSFATRFLERQRRGNWRSPGPVRLEDYNHYSGNGGGGKGVGIVEGLSGGGASNRGRGEDEPSVQSTTNIRVSRRGSITIEKLGAGSQISPPRDEAPLSTARATDAYTEAVNDVVAIDHLRAEHESSLDDMRAEVQRLYSRGEDTQAELSEARAEIQMLRVDAARGEAQTRAYAQGTAALEAAHREIARLRNQVDHMQATMSSKDAELRLLHAQQDRTMKLLDTCTQRRDLLKEDNRLLREELNGLLRAWEHDDRSSMSRGRPGEGAVGRPVVDAPPPKFLPSPPPPQEAQQEAQQQYRQQKQKKAGGDSPAAVAAAASAAEAAASSLQTLEMVSKLVEQNEAAAEAGGVDEPLASSGGSIPQSRQGLMPNRSPPRRKEARAVVGSGFGGTGIPAWQLRSSPSPSKVFISANRRGSVVNPKESRFVVHNERTSSRENAEGHARWNDRLIASWDNSQVSGLVDA